MIKKLVGKIFLAVSFFIGMVGTFKAMSSEAYINPAIPLYILIAVCAIGFLILSD